MELSNGKGPSRVNLGFVEPWTKDVFALGFVTSMELCRGLPRTGLGFCKPLWISKREGWVWWVLRAVQVLCSYIHASYKVAGTGDTVVSISGTHQRRTLGFASPLEDWPGNFPTWVLSTVLLHTLHTYHSPWVVCTEDVVICFCNMSLAMSGTHWSLGRVLVGICHSPWVTCTGVTVMRSYMYVTRCGWHILESRWKYALACMSLVIGDTHWILSSMLLHICLLRSGAYWRLNNVLLRACHSSYEACTRGLVECSCAHVVGGTY